jgi:hypothetical protein
VAIIQKNNLAIFGYILDKKGETKKENSFIFLGYPLQLYHINSAIWNYFSLSKFDEFGPFLFHEKTCA